LHSLFYFLLNPCLVRLIPGLHFQDKPRCKGKERPYPSLVPMRVAIFYFLLVFSFTAHSQQFSHRLASKHQQQAWRLDMPAILRRVQPPQFRQASVTVSTNLNFRQFVQNIIDSLSSAGGGTIIIAPGSYQSHGPIHLKTGINFNVAKGASIFFSSQPKDYLPLVKVRWEGTVCYNYSPLVYAFRQKNIALTGSGTLHGGAANFWHSWKKQPDGNDQEKDKKTLRDMGRDGIPEAERRFGEGHKLRPTLIELYECENILIEGLTLEQSPFWTVHPVFSRNIIIRELTIRKGTTNDDGIDPDSCEDVLIENCDIDTDDDPIAIKAGRDNDAWQRPGSKNIVIRNIRGRSRVGNGFCIGSEMSGGVENVFVENYHITKADHGINIKSNLDRGGFVRNIYLRNVVIDSAVRTGILMQKDYHSYRGGNYPPKYSALYFENIHIKHVDRKGLRIAGVPSQSINRVWMSKLVVKKQSEDDEIKFINDLFINRKKRALVNHPPE
jgi:polygalacturonase